MKFYVGLFLIILFACKKKNEESVTPTSANKFSIEGTKIKMEGISKQYIGTNAFHSFAAGGSDMNSWNMDIAREFVGNVKEQPITGAVIQDANGAYLHPLQNVVDSNRKNNRITIIGAFGWNGVGANEFTGKRPTQTFWWNEFKIKLQQWATHFKDQPDVWIEVWNEPYRYDRADGYTDDIWMSDMNELVSIVRNTGNNNIILVPCAEQGQDESVLNNKGTAFLNGKKNILFDVHAYEKWLIVPDANVDSRLQQLKNNNLPIFFGEVAPLNASILMNPQYFLNNTYNRGLSICAWVWKYDGNDTDALLNSNGQPNNNNNNNWGSLYKSLAARLRMPQ
jgi:mannan endo-1,4-beta-mannosidase